MAGPILTNYTLLESSRGALQFDLGPDLGPARAPDAPPLDPPLLGVILSPEKCYISGTNPVDHTCD